MLRRPPTSCRAGLRRWLAVAAGAQRRPYSIASTARTDYNPLLVAGGPAPGAAADDRTLREILYAPSYCCWARGGR